MPDAIAIRRCRGNRAAWAALWNGRDDLVITTRLALGSLVEDLREKYPASEITIAPD